MSDDWKAKFEELEDMIAAVMEYLNQAWDDADRDTDVRVVRSLFMARELARGRTEVELLREILYTDNHIAGQR